ncbi:MAG: inorganic pyrophosphatase [Bacteroidetes bacterium]|jgi:inorganic pyrophosphatase|nr:inorganic pyrophosphatase [Bacteroidota bacterium]
MKVQLYKPHPWHGIPVGDNCPNSITAYIEMVPNDTVKYEIDKLTGYRKVDRPQKFSNIVPALYGFIPQTYCDELVREFAAQKSGKNVTKGDGDPLDICVLTERNITSGDIILEAIPIGGFRMIDKGEADDKIIAVLKSDEIYGGLKDVSECPPTLINRLKHYFLTYKNIPGSDKTVVEITHTYGTEEAHEVIRRSLIDYNNRFRSHMEIGV